MIKMEYVEHNICNLNWLSSGVSSNKNKIQVSFYK